MTNIMYKQQTKSMGGGGGGGGGGGVFKKWSWVGGLVLVMRTVSKC
jgi:hypothetical protein